MDILLQVRGKDRKTVVYRRGIISATNGEKEGPQIGDNVYIGVGAKIIGKVKVADNVAIGANAVVKSIVEEGITVAGVLAKK